MKLYRVSWESANDQHDADFRPTLAGTVVVEAENETAAIDVIYVQIVGYVQSLVATGTIRWHDRPSISVGFFVEEHTERHLLYSTQLDTPTVRP